MREHLFFSAAAATNSEDNELDAEAMECIGFGALLFAFVCPITIIMFLRRSGSNEGRRGALAEFGPAAAAPHSLCSLSARLRITVAAAAGRGRSLFLRLEGFVFGGGGAGQNIPTQLLARSLLL